VKAALLSFLLVLTLVLGTTDAAPATARSRQLLAWVGPKIPFVGMSRVGFGGPLVTRLPAGRYRIEVHTYPDYVFHLYGPAVDRRTQFGTGGGFVLTTWAVRLRRGLYRYRAEGLDAGMLARRGVRISGSFVVR
jgi:hypothetical protein